VNQAPMNRREITAVLKTPTRDAPDQNGVTKGDCSSLMSEVGSYFDKAAAAVS